MRTSRRRWRWLITVALPFMLKGAIGCAQVADIYLPTKDCQNGKPDEGEDGADCGGVCVGACPGDSCSEATDCASGHCDRDKCVAPKCNDKILNGTETKTDVCPGTQACNENGKCEAPQSP
jgi:hypothetical protein